MKKTVTVVLALVIFFSACNHQAPTPRAQHVILIVLDAMGAFGFQRALTPNMNAMAKNGALSIKARCVLESSSSQNWMSMLTGALPIQHGVTSNDWQPDNSTIEPTLKNKIGFFPSIFDDIKAQKPQYKIFAFRQGKGLGRMFDSSLPDKLVNHRDGKQLMLDAFDAFFSDQPEFLFIGINETDHVGHVSGHESQEYFHCIAQYDSLIGKLALRLATEKMLDHTVVIITGDHGGIGVSHGGETPNEMEIPILLYGGTVTKGKMIEETNIITDVAATVTGLLGVTLPRECVGKFIYAAFEPKTAAQYAPIPFITPQSAFFKTPVKVSLRADSPEANIFYTLDNTEPTTGSPLYQKPFVLDQTTTLKAVSVVGKTSSRREQSFLRIAHETDQPMVRYQYFKNYNLLQVPDFKKMGKPDRTGLIYEFSLAELNLKDKDHFAVQFSSNIQIADVGEYTFSVASDDGGKLYIDDKLVVDNDGSHTRITRKAKISLLKGLHKILVDYFDDYDQEFLEVSYESPTLTKRIIPFNMLKQ